MSEKKFTWVSTYQAIVKYLSDKESKQKELVAFLKLVGVTGFNDVDAGDKEIELAEIDPFTFFCYINKYGTKKRVQILQAIAEKLGVDPPADDAGLPSSQPLQVQLFPYKWERKKGEIGRLWKLFYSTLSDSITDEQFEDILQIKSVGKAKLTEALFYINPEKYYPINGPSKPYLKEVLNLESSFSNFEEYQRLLDNIRAKTSEPFYNLSYIAWAWNQQKNKSNYWVFQCNPKTYKIVEALNDNMVDSWRVTAHEKSIKEGDKFILWVTGEKPGCYALGEISSGVYEGVDKAGQEKYLWGNYSNETKKRVTVDIDFNLASIPIFRHQIENIQVLSELNVGLQGTNFKATQEQFEALLKMIKKSPKRKVWLFAPGESASEWEEFYEKGIMAIGWEALGDLNQYETKEDIVKKLQELESTEGSKKNDASANFEFKSVISEGDLVITKKGSKEYLGYGYVTSPYYYDETRFKFKKCRRVDWKKRGVWIENNNTIVLKTLTEISKYPDYVERLMKLIGIEGAVIQKEQGSVKHSLNVIFYGPPGTGKTYKTLIRAAEIVTGRTIRDYSEAKQIFNQYRGDRIEFITFHQNYSYEDFIQGLRPDTENERDLIFERKDGVFKRIADRALTNIKESEKKFERKRSFEVVFNQFINPLVEGEVDEIEVKMKKTSFWITSVSAKSISFRKTSGDTQHTLSLATLKNMYEAESVLEIQGLSSYYHPLLEKLLVLGKDPSAKTENVVRNNYVIIIDEINRANISRVFGELITLIERDKRSHGEIPLKTTLPSGEEFIVPSNLYIIGTMNTADKSIALLDIALRRRFEFEAHYPSYEIDGFEIYDSEILRKINNQIVKSKGYDFQIGHAYFMGENSDLQERMNKKVIPLLLEYYMNDEKEVKEILSNAGLQLEENVWPLKIKGLRD